VEEARMWYNRRMASRSLLVGALLACAGVLALFLMRTPSTQLLGRVFSGDTLRRTQMESDFDQDGDVDFLDFTVFAAFYEEEG